MKNVTKMQHGILYSWFFLLLINFHKLSIHGSYITKLNDIIKGVSVLDEESSVDIDKDHIRKNPECGYLPGIYSNPKASSRISNAKESEKHYPWVIYVERWNKYIAKIIIGPGGLPCGGSIITSTAAISASHCICDIPEEIENRIPPWDKPYVECLGGRPNIAPNPKVTLRNEIHQFNKLTVGIGSKDKTKQIKVNIPIAYVMGSKRQHFSPLRFEDIGLLLSKDKQGKGVRFYPHNQPFGSINIGSVCLAAEKKDAPHMYDGKVVTVGWGNRYSDVKDSLSQPKQDKHSCVTNEHGPTFGKLRHCDVNDITRNPDNWGCDRSDKPKGYDDVKCKKYLDQAEKGFAEEIMKFVDQDLLWTLWSLANKIEISSSLFLSKQVCYKQKLFDDDGWCYVIDRYNSGANGNGWGFCSSSCKLMQAQRTTPRPKTAPSIYHIMVWEYPFKLPPRCYGHVHNNPNPLRNTKPYYICTASFLPQTIVLKFTKDGKSKLKFSDVYNEKIEDTFDADDVQTMKERGYQLPCKGDSGSGHWMYTSSENKRAALVAIGSHSQGKFCGDSIHNLLTTYPTILKWIKTYSGISNP